MLLLTKNDQKVENVTVSLNGQSTGVWNTDNNGVFSFTNIPVGNDVTITPEKDDDPLNGVTTYDLVLISRHILGVQLLDSPYKIIAADANNSGTVTTFDLVETRKLILMINTEFPNNTSWKFVDKNYIFPNASNPWEEVFPEVINYNNLSNSMTNSDFIAVKIGDVNGSAEANLAANGNDDRSTFESLVLDVEDRMLSVGEEVKVEFGIKETDLSGYQFTLNFDLAKLTFQEVENGLASEENFGFTMLDNGALTTSWNTSDHGKLKQGNVLFSLVFTANQSGMLSEMLDVNSRYTKAEAYRVDGSPLNVDLSFNGQALPSFELYQNTPNPFNAQTMIGFNLPEGGFATLSITDFSGRLLQRVEREFTKGYNEIQVNSSDLPSSGVLYYTLESATETATRKMIVVE